MDKLMNNWDQAPLLRAGTDAVDTAVQLTNENEVFCTIPFSTRFNVGNIHEIKKMWGETTLS
ncbi:hypothetical protein [Pseudomonas sp. E102]|uniref:hypothetical protein n=1 Tax=Pseudomonas sp. E102 TaxID=181579 RepID=UPI004045F5B8